MAAEVSLAAKAAWAGGSLAGVALGGAAWGYYRGWAPITVVRKGAVIVFACGAIVTVMSIDELRGKSVETVAQGIEQDAAKQHPDKSLARGKTLVAATRALKLIEDSEG